MNSDPDDMNATETSGAACSLDRAAGNVCGTTLWQRPKFDSRFLLLATTLTGIWMALYGGLYRMPVVPILDVASLVVVAVIMLTYLFGCPRTRRAVLWTAPALYLPVVLLICCFVVRSQSFVNVRLSHGHLPGGILVGFLGFNGGPWETAAITAAAGLTLVLFFAVVLPIRFTNHPPWYFAAPLFLLTFFAAAISYWMWG